MGKFAEAREHFTRLTQIKGEDAQTDYEMGLSFAIERNSEDAARYFKKAIALDPNHAASLNDLAWILATNPKKEVRDGIAAVELATRASKLSTETRFLGTLDAALAEAGKFDEAIRIAQRVKELAASRKETELVTAAEQRLKLYREQKPFHQIK